MPPVSFDQGLVDLLEAAAGALSLTRRCMISGALHDAKSMHYRQPSSAILFIPCANGISHNRADTGDAGKSAGRMSCLIGSIGR